MDDVTFVCFPLQLVVCWQSRRKKRKIRAFARPFIPKIWRETRLRADYSRTAASRFAFEVRRKGVVCFRVCAVRSRWRFGGTANAWWLVWRVGRGWFLGWDLVCALVARCMVAYGYVVALVHGAWVYGCIWVYGHIGGHSVGSEHTGPPSAATAMLSPCIGKTHILLTDLLNCDVAVFIVTTRVIWSLPG